MSAACGPNIEESFLVSTLVELKGYKFNVTITPLNCHICHPSKSNLYVIFVLSMKNFNYKILNHVRK